MSKQINSLVNINIEFMAHNIITEAIDSKFIDKFDLILLRDVIEHLDNPEIALSKIKTMLKPGGKLYVTFPPYHSAFGGHQHTLMNFVGKIPYIHNLPRNIFFSLIKNGRFPDIEEVKRLNDIKLTPQKMLQYIQNTDYKIIKEEYFLVRPVYKMKFGLPSIKLTLLRHFPLVKSILSMEAGYILEK
jgi:SAM-dependent methyltransferase